MKHKRKAIVIGITSNWAFAAATVLLGLRKETEPLDFDIIILHNGLSAHNITLLSKILPCEFIAVNEFIEKIPENKKLSSMAFSRFLCFGMLESYQRVVWLDADVLIKKNINGIFSFGSLGAAMLPHEGKTLQSVYNLKKSFFPEYDLDTTLFNDGILVLSDEIRNPNRIQDWCFEKAFKWKNVITSDQPIMNFAMQEFNIPIEKLPILFNCPPGDECRDSAVILHPWGREKYWTSIHHPEWDKLYLKWLFLGGKGPLKIVHLLMRTIVRMLKKIRDILYQVFMNGINS